MPWSLYASCTDLAIAMTEPVSVCPCMSPATSNAVAEPFCGCQTTADVKQPLTAKDDMVMMYGCGPLQHFATIDMCQGTTIIR